MTTMSTSSMSKTSSVARGGDTRALQERLHELLSRLSDTTDLLKEWPESEGDDKSVHDDATSRLMESIEEIVRAIERAEGVVKRDEILHKTLQDCAIPLDLLDLMDHANGLNPECFTRGFLREALSQLAGLRRRKVALEMLGTAIENGLKRRDAEESKIEAFGVKRGRDDDGNNTAEGSEPPFKRAHTEAAM
jgi:hypothetical protein